MWPTVLPKRENLCPEFPLINARLVNVERGGGRGGPMGPCEMCTGLSGAESVNVKVL